MSIDECRIKEFFLFYLLKKEQSEATSTNLQSSIVNIQFSASGGSGLGFILTRYPEPLARTFAFRVTF
jgi:hypothetical protein